MKKRVMAAVLAVLMGMSVTACGGQNEVKEVNSVSVSGMFPETGDVIVTNTYIGTVAPKESIDVYPMKSGNVLEVSATVGKQVKKGDILFKIDSLETDFEIADAEEELEKAEKLAEQAKEDAKELEEALEKVEGASEKASLELELEQLKKDLETAKKVRDAKKNDYEYLKDQYSKKQSTWERDLREAKADARDLAKELWDNAEKKVTEIEKEIQALEKSIEALSKSITTTSNSSTSSTSNSTTNTKKPTSSTDSKDKDSEDKDSGNKTSSDNKTVEITVETTVYDQMVEDAQKKLEEAKAKLELYQISAPIDGTVEAVYVQTNEKAFEDQVSLIISNKSNMEVTFQVPEAAALELQTGDKIKVEKNGAMNEASITEVAIMADPQTKLFTVKASLGAVSGFSTGTDVKVYAETQKARGVMRLPYDTLYFQGDEAYVYCVSDDEAVRRTVQVGLMNDEYAQILDGLGEEDIVISTWSSQLKDGTEVDLLFVIGGNTVDMTEDGMTEDGMAEDDVAEDDVADDAENTTENEINFGNTETENTETENTEEEYKWVLPELD